MLFDPVSNLVGPQARTEAGGRFGPVGLRVLAGDRVVGQVCCDPGTFADVSTLVALDGRGVEVAPVPVDARARALLRLVWPATAGHARLAWGGRLRRRAAAAGGGIGPETGAGKGLAGGGVEELAAAVVAEVTGMPAGDLLGVVQQAGAAVPACDDAVVRAAVPMAVLRGAVGRVVRERVNGAAEAGPPGTVLDELLLWRGLGREEVSLDEVGALATALTAAAWDATCRALRKHPADRTIGWVRVATQAVVLDGVRIPAGARCLLLVDAAGSGGRPALEALRWLSAGAPDGAGAVFARLAVEAIRPAAAVGRERRREPWPSLPAVRRAARRSAFRSR